MCQRPWDGAAVQPTQSCGLWWDARKLRGVLDEDLDALCQNGTLRNELIVDLFPVNDSLVTLLRMNDQMAIRGGLGTSCTPEHIIALESSVSDYHGQSGIPGYHTSLVCLAIIVWYAWLLMCHQGSVRTDGSSNGDRDPKDFADALPHVHVVLAFAEAL